MFLSNAFIARISLIISIIGILGMVFVSYFFEPIEITELKKEHLEQKISVNGIPSNSFIVKNVLLFYIKPFENSKKIKCVIFSPSQKQIELINSKQLIQVIGIVKEYEKELEIVVDKVITVD